MTSGSILIIRLGAMGDILHALPALRALRLSFPQSDIHWVVASKWSPLLEGNPDLTGWIPLELRDIGNIMSASRRLRRLTPQLAFDFQGLIQSAIAGRLARPSEFYGFSRSAAREGLASFFYTHRIDPVSRHVVDRNLDLIEAAGTPRTSSPPWIPPGRREGQLPSEPFVLSNPFAGWTGKQWPIERYDALARLLEPHGFSLVLNVPIERARDVSGLRHVQLYYSSLHGLIDATRRAAAVVGLDSGPLHLAAALQKPGVALFGPTDPDRNGPYGGSMSVLRAESVSTTYRRHKTIHPSMAEISAELVLDTLLQSMKQRPVIVERSV